MSKGTITTNTFTSDAIAIPVAPQRNTPLTLFAAGTFGSGTLKVQVSPDSNPSNAVDLTGISLTAAGYKTLPLIQGYFFVVLTGATSPSINWWLQ